MFTVAAALLSIVGVGVIARPPMLTGEASWDTDTLVRNSGKILPVGFEDDIP